eukprot:2754505-Amphidinium_carterae.1
MRLRQHTPLCCSHYRNDIELLLNSMVSFLSHQGIKWEDAHETSSPQKSMFSTQRYRGSQLKSLHKD